MNIAIMGTGDLGGYIGGCLARSGRDVTFIARGAQLTAIREHGLQVRTAHDDFHVHPAQATELPSEVGPVDLIILSVKAYDSVAAIEMMRPMVGPHTSIIPVLNGIDHLHTLCDGLGRDHILGGKTFLTAHLTSPGVVERQGTHGVLEFGELSGGFSPRTESLQTVLGIDGLVGKAVPDVIKCMWEKICHHLRRGHVQCREGGCRATAEYPRNPRGDVACRVGGHRRCSS